MSDFRKGKGGYAFWERERSNGTHTLNTARHHAKVQRYGRTFSWAVWRCRRGLGLKQIAHGECPTAHNARRCATDVIVAHEGGRRIG